MRFRSVFRTDRTKAPPFREIDRCSCGFNLVDGRRGHTIIVRVLRRCHVLIAVILDLTLITPTDDIPIFNAVIISAAIAIAFSVD